MKMSYYMLATILADIEAMNLRNGIEITEFDGFIDFLMHNDTDTVDFNLIEKDDK